jgi:hypothetical protein
MNLLSKEEIRDRVHSIIDELYQDRKNLKWSLNWNDISVVDITENIVTLDEVDPEETNLKEGIEKIYSMKYNEQIVVHTKW